MNLYFIKGDGPSNWGATKLTLTKNASVTAVIRKMEADGWKCVTSHTFNVWRKKNQTKQPQAA